ncbi:MAG: transposase, partial [Wujia sp.]
WERYPNYLRKHFWKEHTFWTDGYFACSVGNVSEEMPRKYIEKQG